MVDRRRVNVNNLKHIRLTNEMEVITLGEVINSCESLKVKYAQERQNTENTWKDAWAIYLTTPEAKQYAESRVIDVVGNVDFNWRHKLVTAKAFETVETIVSYMMSSFFPNQKWFDFSPRVHIPHPEWRSIVEANRKFIDLKLDSENFRSVFENFIRELCITGSAGISMPWRTEVKDSFTNTLVQRDDGTTLVIPKRDVDVVKHAPDLEVISVLDFYFDPEIHDPNRSNVIRRFSISRGDLLELVKSNKYPLANIEKIRDDFITGSDTLLDNNTFDINLMVGISSAESLDGDTGNTSTNTFIGNNLIEVFEFWGDIVVKNLEFKDVHIVWTGKHLLVLEQNPYWSGKPFVFGTYVKITGTPYGIGCLQPVLSSLYQQNILMSRRADGITVVSDPMFTVLADGVTDMDEVYTAPGHKIPVVSHDAIRPIEMDRDQSLSVNEQSILEQLVDKATGTGPFIGVGAGRSAERVTAQEIQAQRDAGGNRLNGIYSHIERTSMIPFLNKYRELCRQFILEPESVMMSVNGLDVEVLFGPDLLQFPMSVRALGAGHISDKEFELRQLLDWINLVVSVEGFSSLLSVTHRLEILRALTEKMIPDLVEKVIPTSQQLLQANQDQQALIQQQQAATAPPQDPTQQLRDSAQFVGGQPAVNSIDEAMLTGRSEEQIQQIAAALGLS